MAPKKAAVSVVEPAATEAKAEEKAKKTVDSAAVRKLATHPSTVVMVREAIKALDSRKGVSSPAIQNYIKQKYPSVDLVRLKGLVRKALKKGLENGTLVRPANATVTTGATGRFRLARKGKEPKAKSENLDPNAQKAPKAGKGKGEAKKKKTDAGQKSVKGDNSSEAPKPVKRSKKDDEQGSSAKVAPAKKPKAKKAAETEKVEHSESVKPKGKAAKAPEEDKKLETTKKASQNKKGGKTAQSKSQPATSAGEPSKAQGKRKKVASE